MKIALTFLIMEHQYDLYADDSLSLIQIVQILEKKYGLKYHVSSYAFSCMQSQSVCLYHSLKQLHIHSGDFILLTCDE